ncbi:hypothetical protein HNQ94_000397 [Salirhabdus euzebyi]|uniref:Uncharacterized protein n=1 Tax=Salirhabdus euzebyi TaxID=394506 RepID=A0A841PX53_9BACI|nr:hypothetical protein [Salirhabdus euzebyi]MBB6451976.1 hypothetical protein [Salirhabdus euzebyi]
MSEVEVNNVSKVGFDANLRGASFIPYVRNVLYETIRIQSQKVFLTSTHVADMPKEREA